MTLVTINTKAIVYGGILYYSIISNKINLSIILANLVSIFANIKRFFLLALNIREKSCLQN